MARLPLHVSKMLYQIGEIRDAMRRLKPSLKAAVLREIVSKVNKLVKTHVKELKKDPEARPRLASHAFNTAAGLMAYIAKRSRAEAVEAASENEVEAAEMAEDEAEDEAGDEAAQPAAFVELSCSALTLRVAGARNQEIGSDIRGA